MGDTRRETQMGDARRENARPRNRENARTLRIVPIDVEDGRVDHLADVRAVERGARVVRGCGVPDAVAARAK